MADPADFAVLAPVHAGDDPAHFGAAMASVAHAGLPPADFVICQDGDLPEALRSAVTRLVRDSGARVIRNAGPPGLAHNLNCAMSGVRAAWVARVDADDINLPGRFAAQAAFLRQNPGVAVVGGRIVEFAPDGTRRRKPMPLSHDAIVRRARWRNPINHMTVFFRADAFRACGGYPTIPLKEDYALWLTMIGRGFRLANLDQDLVEARLGAGFYGRRAGAHNVASEYALYKLKRDIPAIGGAAAWAAWLARTGALAFERPVRLLYERALRR